MLADGPSARVLRALTDAGVFHAGGVLVGTHAFIVLENLLGVRWDELPGTRDAETVTAPRLDVAVPAISACLPSALESLRTGFLPVPGFDPRSPTTAFKVRGRGVDLRLLTPPTRSRTARLPTAQDPPVSLPRFAAAEQPLRFLDYLIDSPVPAAAINDGVVAVNVPNPARFALHKLIVAGERPAAMHSKRDKDLAQAAQIIEVLHSDRPGDLLLAWEALAARGKPWTGRVEKSLAALERVSAEAVQGVRELAAAGL